MSAPDSQPRVRGVKHLAFALLTVTGSLLLVLLAAEGSLRWFLRPADFPGDRVLSRRFHAHRHLRYTSKQGEFDVVSHYNSDGMRDRERSRVKAPGTRRIVVIGDSFTEAKQVPVEETFPALLEFLLSGGEPTEVINAGHSGFGSAEEFLVLKHFGISRDPDLVIQAFFPNDVFEDAQIEDQIEWDEDGVPVRFRGQLIEVRRVVKDALRRLPFIWKTKVIDRNTLGELQRDPFAVVRSRVPTDDEHWAITLRAIEAASRLSNQHGAGYLLVLIPLALQVDPSHQDAVSEAYALTPEDISDAPQRRLLAFCRERGIPVLDLSPALARQAKRKLYYDYDGHWTPAGHEVTAHAIAGFLDENGWSASP